MSMDQEIFKCPACGGKLEPIYFQQQETKILNGSLIYTGRKRIAVDCLSCKSCMHNECVDDSLDGEWHY